MLPENIYIQPHILHTLTYTQACYTHGGQTLYTLTSKSTPHRERKTTTDWRAGGTSYMRRHHDECCCSNRNERKATTLVCSCVCGVPYTSCRLFEPSSVMTETYQQRAPNNSQSQPEKHNNNRARIYTRDTTEQCARNTRSTRCVYES